MAGREETLLFLVDVKVRGQQALAALRAEMDALDARSEKYGVLSSAAQNAAANHSSLADEIDRVNAAAASPVPQQPGNSSGIGVVSGSRSDRFPGSRTNPEIFAEESGQAAGLGSLAADASSVQRPSAARPTAMGAATDATNAATLTDAVRKGTQSAMGAEDDRLATMLQQAQTMNRNASRLGGPQIWDQAALDAMHAAESAPSGRTLTSGDVAQRLGISRAAAQEMAATGGLPGARKENGQWIVPEEAVMSAGGSGGRGGGRVPPVAYGGAGGRGFGGSGGGFGNGRSRTQFLPWRGLVTGPDSKDSPFSFGNLFKGDGGNGGAFGLPGFGSIGSLGGLGLEHWLLTGLGLTASAGSAIGGAGLLGASSLTQAAVGGGSDALVGHAALTNVKAAIPIYQALTAAVAQYGPASKQAAAAQAAWDAEIQKVGPQVAAVAKNYSDLKTEFATDSKGAQQQSAAIMNQVVGLGQNYVPLVTAAARRNLGEINTGLKPLFSWLEGPEGIGIFDTLENKFSQDLPTSIHALDTGIEDFLRLMQAASKYTGGFSRDLDNFFTGKSKESTAQYDEEVQKLVGDLKEWEALLKVLAQDMGGIFRADQGTANSIVGELTQMLDKLHTWENTTTGQVDLQNIFQVHKKEIEAILQLLPELVKGYGTFYSDVAPEVVTAFTDILDVVNPLLTAIEKIPGGAEAIGGAIILAKLGILKGAVSGLAGAFGLLADKEKAASGLSLLAGAKGVAGGTAAGAVAGGAASDAEDAIEGGGAAALVSSRGGALTTLLGKYLGGDAIAGGVVEGSAIGGASLAIGGGETAGVLGSGLAAGGVALAPIIGTIVPIAAAALAAYGGYKLVSTIFGSGSTATTSYSSNSLTSLLQKHGTAALGMQSNPKATQVGSPSATTGALASLAAQQGTGGSTSLGNIASTKQAQNALESYLNTMRNTADVAKMSASQLQGMVNEGQALAQMFPKDSDAIDKFTARAQQDLGSVQGAVKLVMARWNADGDAGLKTLSAVFAANTELIANDIGLSSTQGERAMHTNVQKMVTDLTTGMANGNIAVTAGMSEITAALSAGMKDGADNWKTYVTDMLNSLSKLRSSGKISVGLYNTDVNDALTQGAMAVHASVLAQYAQMEIDVKQKFQQGDDGLVVTQQGLVKQLEGLHAQALQAASSSEIYFLTNLEESLKAAGRLTVSEMSAITAELGSADAKASASAVAFQGASHRLAGAPGHAVGGKVTTPTYMVGEEGAAHPEFVLATNPAYRNRNVDLWAQAGHALGVKGFAQGGTPSASWLKNVSTEWGSQQFLWAQSQGYLYAPPKVSTKDTPGSPQFFQAINILNQNLTKWLSQETATFNKLQTTSSNQSTLATTLQGLNPGTKLNLSGAALKATGLSSKQISALVGGGAAGYGAMADLDKDQASQYQAQATQLQAKYKQAVKDHDKTLQTSLLSQLSAVDSAMVTAISDGQQAIVAKIQAQAGVYADNATAAGNVVTSLQAIQNLAPGDSLSSLGLSPAILATLGLSGDQSQVGTGLSYYQNLLSTNGSLTSAQIASATSGVNAQNASIQSEEAPIEQELQYYQSNLGSLKGSNYTAAIAAMQSLAQQLLGLQSTVDQNNQGLQALTTATTANTSAVNSSTQVTGTVSYQFNSQSYLASDTVVGLGVGG